MVFRTHPTSLFFFLTAFIQSDNSFSLTENRGEPVGACLAFLAGSSQPGLAAPKAVESSGAKGEVGEVTPIEVMVGLRLRLMLLLVEGALSARRKDNLA